MQQPRRDLWTPVAGVLAAVTFVVGIVFGSDGPDSTDSDAKVLAWYADHGHRVQHIIGLYLLALCGLFLVWFGAGLRQRLRTVEGPGGRLTNIAFAGATLSAAMIWVGAAAIASISGAKSLGGTPGPTTADIARFLPQIGYAAILIFAMFGAIAMIDATSIVAWRTGILPRWFAYLGFLCGIVLLFAVVFLPMVAFPIWLLAASFVFFKLPSIEAEPVTIVPEP
jgi:hypothetical protein